MKYILPILLFFCLGSNLMGQVAEEPEDGTVSYITSQNIYVKFKSTDNISLGDTLFISKEGNLTPALVVSNKSSISCVCKPISSEPFSVSDKIIIKQKPNLKPTTVEQVKEEPVNDQPQKQGSDGKTMKTGTVNQPDLKTGNASSAMEEKVKPQQDISGRLSISSYSNFSNTPGGNSQRMRYTFSLNAKNIANSKLSGESYISFVHKDGEWNEIQDNIFNGLKIYNLSLNYEFNKYVKLTAGRKINPRLSNMGAIDGLQLEIKFKSFTAGIIAGSRPDYEDYSLNTSLFQYGAFLSHDLVSRKGNMQSTLAYAEQKNNGATDRRFLYFQHTNSLVKNLYFFGTIEFDLYKYDTVNEKLQNAFDLSNLYISLRYRVIRQLSFAVSYSSRQNVIYYETYKNILDQILDYEALQGFSFQANYNPVKFLSVGIKTGYRYRKSDPRPTRNLYGYVTYSRIPWLKMSSTASVTFLETGYVSGKIYSIGLSKDLLRGKLFASLGYRYVNYSYFNAESSVPQNMAEINLNWNIYKKLALSANYEGTFEQENKFTRLYFNLTQRF
jgi:hypothetical protein